MSLKCIIIVYSFSYSVYQTFLLTKNCKVQGTQNVIHYSVFFSSTTYCTVDGEILANSNSDAGVSDDINKFYKITVFVMKRVVRLARFLTFDILHCLMRESTQKPCLNSGKIIK